MLDFKAHQTCTGTKNKHFELQSAPNLHRDQKKQKTNIFQSTWEESTIPLKFLFFSVFFCHCAGLVHFEVHNFCFFCPCAGLVHFEA